MTPKNIWIHLMSDCPALQPCLATNNLYICETHPTISSLRLRIREGLPRRVLIEAESHHRILS